MENLYLQIYSDIENFKSVTPFYMPGSKDAVKIMLDSAYLKFL
jgi:hypothetical protein